MEDYKDYHDDENFIYDFQTSIVIFGMSQFLPGYLVQIARGDYKCITDMPMGTRTLYLQEMSWIGEGMLQVLGCDKVNYHLLSNSMEYVHTHLFPRYEWEAEDLRKGPVYYYDKKCWHDRETVYDAEKFADTKMELIKFFNRGYLL